MERTVKELEEDQKEKSASMKGTIVYCLLKLFYLCFI